MSTLRFRLKNIWSDDGNTNIKFTTKSWLTLQVHISLITVPEGQSKSTPFRRQSLYKLFF